MYYFDVLIFDRWVDIFKKRPIYKNHLLLLADNCSTCEMSVREKGRGMRVPCTLKFSGEERTDKPFVIRII